MPQIGKMSHQLLDALTVVDLDRRNPLVMLASDGHERDVALTQSAHLTAVPLQSVHDEAIDGGLRNRLEHGPSQRRSEQKSGSFTLTGLSDALQKLG